MSLHLILLFAGIAAFVLALVLFRADRPAHSVPGSIWRQGRATARIALLLWWTSLVLAAASMVARFATG